MSTNQTTAHSLASGQASLLQSRLNEHGVDPSLAHVLLHISNGCKNVSNGLRSHIVKTSSVNNNFGDEVLSVDVMAEQTLEECIQDCPCIAAFISEEKPVRTLTHMGASASETSSHGPAGEKKKYTVAFDPLDGSSVIATNFTVGSIFSIWPGNDVIGLKVRDQAACAVAVYGPRTVLFIAIPGKPVLDEYVLQNDNWFFVPQEKPFQLRSRASVFAPGNLRATQVLPWYNEIVEYYIKSQSTLRYTGSMVPDVCQMLVKRNGIFMTPASPEHKVKLRVLFETAPLALLVVCAGGKVTTGECDMMDLVVQAYDQTSPVAMGCAWDVEQYERACRYASQTPYSKSTSAAKL